MLLDQCSYVVLLKTGEAHKRIDDLRTQWLAGEKVRRDEHDVAMKAFTTGPGLGDRPKLADHPLGCSMRALLFAAMFEYTGSKLGDSATERQDVKKLGGLSVEDVESSIFRMKARRETYREGRVWIWAIVLQEEPSVDYFGQILSRCCKISLPDLPFNAQHSQDGPTVKWLNGVASQAAGDDEDTGHAHRKRQRHCTQQW